MRTSDCNMFKLYVQIPIKKMKIPIRLNYVYNLIVIPSPEKVFVRENRSFTSSTTL